MSEAHLITAGFGIAALLHNRHTAARFHRFSWTPWVHRIHQNRTLPTARAHQYLERRSATMLSRLSEAKALVPSGGSSRMGGLLLQPQWIVPLAQRLRNQNSNQCCPISRPCWRAGIAHLLTPAVKC